MSTNYLKDFVPYEQALALKKLGFDEPCLAKYSIDIVGETIPHFRYNNRISQAESIDEGVWFNHNLDKDHICSAPTFSQVFRWFREKHNLKSCIMFRTSMEDNKEYYDWLIKGQEVVYRHFNTYEEAELACLKKLIEIVKNIQK